MEQELNTILYDYMMDFELKKHKSFVVETIPIVWFGDLEKYRKSKIKIITVGLNPSLNEFPVFEKPRFDLKANDEESFYQTYNNYFYNNPYKQWFRHFERCLNRIDASYGGKLSDMDYANTAIHLDAFSSIATNSKWRELLEWQKAEVNQEHLFQRLLEYLDPDVILMSVKHDYFIETLHINKPIEVFYEHRKVEIYMDSNGRVLIYGRNMKGQPFGGITNEILDRAFQAARRIL